jgi:hypothetical protein
VLHYKRNAAKRRCDIAANSLRASRKMSLLSLHQQCSSDDCVLSSRYMSSSQRRPSADALRGAGNRGAANLSWLVCALIGAVPDEWRQKGRRGNAIAHMKQ